jgi:phytoene synthase
MPHFSSTADRNDLAACRAQLCHGSRSFYAASLLLPARVRDPATALYAFCRQADDAVDLGADPRAALVELSARLDAAYAGNPVAAPADRAFAATVAAFGIPKTLPAALIEGLTWDAEGRRYESLEALLDYAARVAGAVGVMMALIMGVRGSAALARAADLGAAMQLTNIARDVGEDARAGRLFLPLDWLAEAGIAPEGFLADPRATPEVRGLVRRLLAEADTLYARAAAGIALLPWECRTGIGAAHRIYAAIGKKIAEAGYDSISVRARVGGAEKLALALRAGVGAVAAMESVKHLAALPANAFLVEAAAYDAPAEPGGVAKLLLLFERLERSQREAAGRLTA